MDYFFYLYISDKYLQFRKKSILIWAINFIIKSITKGIYHEASGYTFYKQKKHLLGNIFDLAHASNRIYLLQNCFSNYVYLKDMYMTLKGIGKILFVLALKILLICKFLNSTAAFTKKRN